MKTIFVIYKKLQDNESALYYSDSWNVANEYAAMIESTSNDCETVIERFNTDNNDIELNKDVVCVSKTDIASGETYIVDLYSVDDIDKASKFVNTLDSNTQVYFMDTIECLVK